MTVSGDQMIIVVLALIVLGLLLMRRRTGPVAVVSGDSSGALDSGSRALNDGGHSLQQNARHFQAMADAMPQIVWSATEDGQIDFYNRRWDEYTGFTYEQTKGSGWLNALHPEDAERTRRLWMQAVRSGEPLAVEYRIRRGQDGIYRWFLARAVPIKEEHGAVEKWFGSSTDIDDQKRVAELLEAQVAERTQRLAESERKFHVLFNNTFQMIALTEPSGAVLELNKATLQAFGVQAEPCIGKLLWELPFWEGPGDLAAKMKVALLQAAAGESVRLENLHVRADELTYVDCSIKPVFVDAARGEVRWLLVEGHDITAQKHAAEAIGAQAEQLKALTDKLSLSNKDLRQFAYVASHDLQEPLRTVISFSGLLAKNHRDQLDEDAQKYLDIMVSAVSRMQQLIKDLLIYAQVETQGKPLLKINLAKPVEEAIAALKTAIEENDATITFDPMPDVLGDSVQLSFMFQNLFSNAIKFKCEKSPRVHVAVAADGDYWRVLVADNGIGIKSTYAGKIFVIFQRLHSREEYPGTGIGLAVCKRIVERHGGNIELATRVEGDSGGATFAISLPRLT
ncbi:MAG: PAS domain S-box protein [Cyanobacteria bacterium REEB67]|nr:PAS domain S-box protein [Cyanobacteria bacterium REEB67]